MNDIFNKIKLGSCVAAPLFFFFPWVGINLLGKSFVSQSGFQVMLGSASVAGG